MLGLELTVETDRKLLIPLLNVTEIYKWLPCIQHFRPPLTRYKLTVFNIVGKNHITADALSTAPVRKPNSTDVDLTEGVTAFAIHVFKNPAYYQ